jgi:hypothetical protein
MKVSLVTWGHLVSPDLLGSLDLPVPLSSCGKMVLKVMTALWDLLVSRVLLVVQVLPVRMLLPLSCSLMGRRATMGRRVCLVFKVRRA